MNHRKKCFPISSSGLDNRGFTPFRLALVIFSCYLSLLLVLRPFFSFSCVTLLNQSLLVLHPSLFVFRRHSTRLVLISSLLVLCSVLALFVFKRHSACHCSLLVHCLPFSQPFPFRYHCSLFVTAVSFSSLIQKGFVTVILLLSLIVWCFYFLGYTLNGLPLLQKVLSDVVG
ncbi:hypothetical protein BDB00DRAFT_820201 [Zychaea mexicana]|uniref:uncharacterized protein n=1 Tax=Zychaea mexicana TaxID=64656 RepID=UPI0022FE3996|nr:uncharacterized protein BDB00DRAFT_820201 [Zychaea mexicana]KAI9493976.1 hypothetical protein BDB00DRAFT_820201 [Zychaea mexicana]